jgi:antitoxin CptB
MERSAYDKLRWRCIRRGLLEVDLCLNRFLDTGFDQLDERQQLVFAELADMDDYDLWGFFSGQTECDDPRLAEIVELVRKN